MNKSFPSFWSKHPLTRQHDVELGQAAEEKGGQGGRKEGQVLAEPLLQGLAIFALKNLWANVSITYKIQLIHQFHLCFVSEKGPPVECSDNMAYQEEAHRGNEKVVEIETLKT